MKKRRFSSLTAMYALLLVGCAGISRSCSSCQAENFGADWVVVQMDLEGRPFRCWALQDTSIDNEPQSDGIYWKENGTGNLVHISGLYNRVQVVGGNWNNAFKELGLTKEACGVIRERLYNVKSSSYTTPAAKAEEAEKE